VDTQISDYRIRHARANEVARIRQIEDEAGTMFSGLGLFDEALDLSFPLDAIARLIGKRQVWVACQADDVPVGMVIASVREGAAYIEELDVIPKHGRRGLGSRLVARVCEWARAHDYPTVTLSTFRDVPWNAPFYRKRGFTELSPADLTPDLLAIREREVQHGLRIDARIFMRRVIIETGDPESDSV
jgi:GNAT superfamily N-acetyltransferase